ncbi:hypothetical protein HMPREF1549_03446 [Actinomyces johnsonii F0510]|uniref:Uncharacterized protein n=1 Tax=Actinomyces johnsonii F0510 TaxID=1227262 RepID=U1R429_9ACTO|nr:hypothetical protein HMPREF1549_03446 [Actinomyces johnsonii F0510]
MRFGSSPLARGLRRFLDAVFVDGGIIPARAGFTQRPAPVPGGRGDHPRSRGVYLCSSQPTRTTLGSSPLARGLRPSRARTGHSERIIPARAGFTASTWKPCRWIGDHPRSRGFTGRHVTHRSLSTDHPRSRGVYRRTRGHSGSSRGSSPLARGLHDQVRGRGADRGIIPARAGFTQASRTPSTASTDHPRSRGVYTDGRGGHWEYRGSSPLARGLPDPGHGWVNELRIIPARAGFTPSAPSPLHSCTDHPRSRGVYPPSRFSTPVPAGSSPLARGLLPRCS